MNEPAIAPAPVSTASAAYSLVYAYDNLVNAYAVDCNANYFGNWDILNCSSLSFYKCNGSSFNYVFNSLYSSDCSICYLANYKFNTYGYLLYLNILSRSDLLDSIC